jgi:CheY-like chemotaxis protein
VLADELMPMKGGLDLLAAMRNDPTLARRALVLLSLFGAEQDDTDTWTHKPDAVGLKPIRAATLSALLDQVLTGDSPSQTLGARRCRPTPPSAAPASCWSRTIP